MNSIDSCGEGSVGNGQQEFVTGCRDGSAKVWDPRTGAAVVTVEPSSSGADCWAVCFGNASTGEERCIVAGYDTGDVKLLDLKTTSVKWETTVSSGVCHLSFDRKDIAMNKLSVSSLEGQVNVFDMRTHNPKSGFAACSASIGKSTLWGCNYLPQNREVMSLTDGCGNLMLYKYSYPDKRQITGADGLPVGVPGTLEPLCFTQNLSTQPIVSFDWHSEKRGLAAMASLEQSVKVLICTKLESIN